MTSTYAYVFGCVAIDGPRTSSLKTVNAPKRSRTLAAAHGTEKCVLAETPSIDYRGYIRCLADRDCRRCHIQPWKPVTDRAGIVKRRMDAGSPTCVLNTYP